ncbi:replication-associated recombination protein A [Lujinxingia sediminis]|uniref:Replication-associated recombination protein A n=1 Tax=Lujinxingia sediminis TaxID=2480984 RepID=A0ABY0CPB0_9DELT|nr:replication-associated recombination protein A [Lujinxingia sediminis]RVU41457.1 replication-associated recombination protein A [Lujinxingia sediminis]
MSSPNARRPLAERMRPSTLEHFVGQRHLLAEGKLLASALSRGRLPSLILWGPPGCGKTTLAKILSDEVGAQLAPLSAVSGGVKDIRQAVEQAGDLRRMLGQTTVLFVDEIHRFNKAQQDALLPHVEQGTVTLIGATTENPSFEVNAALLSRCRTLVLEALDEAALERILRQALTDRARGLGLPDEALSDDALGALLNVAEGDARSALNTLELAATFAAARGSTTIEHPDVEEAAQQRVIRYDKAGDAHYNTVSAFIKSMRGSDPDAAVYYMVRMLEGGEDPLFVLRRMVIFASEDIGNADPGALRVALDAAEAFRFMGMPEGVLPMTQAVIYLACAPKSNSALTTYAAARKALQHSGNLPLPKHLLNAPTKLMANLGHGRGYKYPHNFSGNYVAGESYLPEDLQGQRFYQPGDNEVIPRPPGLDPDAEARRKAAQPEGPSPNPYHKNAT